MLQTIKTTQMKNMLQTIKTTQMKKYVTDYKNNTDEKICYRP
jgi:hypothetical protein